MKKQMSDGNSTCPLDPMDKQNSSGHFQVHWIHWIQWTLSFGYLNGQHPHDVHMLVITSFTYMVIDQMKKQMSDGNSTGPLDPMDTPKSNGQLEIHLTNGMSNGLLIFPSDILHRYWTLIIQEERGASQIAVTTGELRYCHTAPKSWQRFYRCV